MPYRIKHLSSGLYFAPVRKRKVGDKFVKVHLSKKGKVYHDYPSLGWIGHMFADQNGKWHATHWGDWHVEEYTREMVLANQRKLKRIRKPKPKKYWLPEIDRLKRIAGIIEDVETRCMFADGPVSKTRLEMTDDEMRDIYKLATDPWTSKR